MHLRDDSLFMHVRSHTLSQQSNCHSAAPLCSAVILHGPKLWVDLCESFISEDKASSFRLDAVT